LAAMRQVYAVKGAQNAGWRSMSAPPEQPKQAAGAAADARAEFSAFCAATQAKDTLAAFRALQARAGGEVTGKLPFQVMHAKLEGVWKAHQLFDLLKQRASQPEYRHGGLLRGKSVLVVGAGPVGLRAALELAFCGAAVTVVEKREEAFTRVNKLKLWSLAKDDLVLLGAKILFSSAFGADPDICHIGIGQLQLMLFKVALMLNVKILFGYEASGCQAENSDWQCVMTKKGTSDTPAESFAVKVDAVVASDGHGGPFAKKVAGIARVPHKSSAAIGLVANFVNGKTTQERNLRQCSWARQFNEPLFNQLQQHCGAELENAVYYRGEDLHYFVSTPKRSCLEACGIFKDSSLPAEEVLRSSNINQDKLYSFAANIAVFFGLSVDVDNPTTSASSPILAAHTALFDFSTTNRCAEPMAFVPDLVRGKDLPVVLVGDALMEPFWPEGLGIVRGFLSAVDAVNALVTWNADPAQARETACSSLARSYTLLKGLSEKTQFSILARRQPGSGAPPIPLDPEVRYVAF